MTAIEGLILMPGAGGTKDHPTLLALEEAFSPLPVLRHEFSYRREGRRPPPRAPKLVTELLDDRGADPQIRVRSQTVIFGGRSMGVEFAQWLLLKDARRWFAASQLPLHPD